MKPDFLELGKNEYLQLMLPLYGLCESGSYWAETFREYCLREASLDMSPADPALFFRRIGSDLCAISGSYVDDIVAAAPPDMKTEMEQRLRSHFQVSGPEAQSVTESGPAEFCGISLGKIGHAFKASMTAYILRLQPLSPTAVYADFAHLRACLLWCANVRPDVAAYSSLCASVTKERFLEAGTAYVDEMNAALAQLQLTADLGLQFPRLDKDSLHLVIYADAGFQNREDQSSQLGYLVTLADRSGNACVLAYRSQKSQRVCRSAMASETLAFAAAFDAGYTIRRQLEHILARQVPLIMLTDSKSLYDILTGNKRSRELRLMVDLAASREAYDKSEIDVIGLVRSESNYADDLTKLKGNGLLKELMRTGKIQQPVAEYVMR